MGNTSFTIEEVRILSDIIKCIYDPALTLSEFTEVFMAKLKSLIYFDKSDFMFFRYNNDTKKYEMESFRPVNWSTEEINNYVTTYMHNDDVLPILSQRQCIAFRNSDLFSMRERRETKFSGIRFRRQSRNFHRRQHSASGGLRYNCDSGAVPYK